MLAHVVIEFTWETVACYKRIAISSRTMDGSKFGIAEPRCRFDKCVENCLQVESRPADDFEHVGGGRLLLQRFSQLVEQPSVLNSDDGLGGEVLNKLDLLVSEGTNLLTVNTDH